MNTLDIVNKIAVENNISRGRAEMILNIIFEGIIGDLLNSGSLEIKNFGEFSVIEKEIDPIYNPKESGRKMQIVFKPDQKFLDIINS